MDHRTLIFIAIAGSLLTPISACDRPSPTSPTAPPASQAVSVSAVQPNTASTNGTEIVRIFGRGFEPGAAVTVGAAATDVTVVNSTQIRAQVPPHPVGTVDVIVTNPSTRAGILAGAFTYVIVRAPTVTAVSPDIGSTKGGTPVTIRGADFHPTLTVTFGGLDITPFVYQGSIYVTAPAHDPGPVDVVVTNPGAEPSVLARAYTYAPPESFDFNGAWNGDAGSDWEFPLQFTIANNLVTSVRCGGSDVLMFSTPPQVRNGAFAFAVEGAAMTGHIIAPARARGTIDLGACRQVSWYAAQP
jgi:hypothetical protein